jgi:hypothetical protein
MSLFKIRNTETGEFSTGGKSPDFNEKGKVWNSIGHLRNHIAAVLRGSRTKGTYKGCEIVRFSLSEQNTAFIGKDLSETSTQIDKNFFPDKYRAEKAKERAKRKADEIEDAAIAAHQAEVFAEFDREHGITTNETQVEEVVEEDTSPVTSSTPW